MTILIGLNTPNTLILANDCLVNTGGVISIDRKLSAERFLHEVYAMDKAKSVKCGTLSSWSGKEGLGDFEGGPREISGLRKQLSVLCILLIKLLNMEMMPDLLMSLEDFKRKMGEKTGAHILNLMILWKRLE